MYDIAVVGAGAAGCMAAIKASQSGKNVILIERNHIIGKKIMLTSNGRCNLTNAASIQSFIEKFHPHGEFLRTAFFHFTNNDLIEFFKNSGLELKVEDRGRVLPITDKANSVIAILQKTLKENKVIIDYNQRILSIKKENNYFILTTDNNDLILAKKVIISTGGISYKATGSTGDGLTIARQLGHTITELTPALIPLKIKETFIKDLQGLSFTNVQITTINASKKIISEIGDILFTHFGLSGPLILDISSNIVLLLKHNKEIKITIDFQPNIKSANIENKLNDQISKHGNISIGAIIEKTLPKRMVPIFLLILNILPQTKLSQISKKQRLLIANSLKAFPLTITGHLEIDKAMVTQGGVSIKEINPRTMESKIVPGVYFAGEIIEICGTSGGFNLQQAFSTGYLAAESATI